MCLYLPGKYEVLSCMQKILAEMQNRESKFQILCQAYMDIIVVQLARNASVSVAPIHSKLPANRQCATVKRYIDHHYKENITLDQLAEKVSINKYYMAHAFKREYGISPVNYMIDCRIREGKRLLAEQTSRRLKLRPFLDSPPPAISPRPSAMWRGRPLQNTEKPIR